MKPKSVTVLARRLLAGPIALLLVMTATSSSQSIGDFGVASNGKVEKSFQIYDVTSRALKKKVLLPDWPNEVIMDNRETKSSYPGGNDSYLVAGENGIYDITPDGKLATVTRQVKMTVGLAMDDGALLALTAAVLQPGDIYRIGISGSYTTAWKNPGYHSTYRLRWDVDTGDLMASVSKIGNPQPRTECSLIRIDRRGGVSTLFHNTLPPLWFVDFDQDPVAGDFVAMTTYRLYRVSPKGPVTSVVHQCPVNVYSLALLPTGHPDGGGNLVVGGWKDTRSGLYVLDARSGGLISTVVEYTGAAAEEFRPWGVTVYHSHALTGTGSGSIGTGYRLKLRTDYRRAVQKPYVLAAALSPRPGIRLADGRIISLAFDPVLVMTIWNLLPDVFQRFQGQLDMYGDADATVRIPADPGLVGLRTFYAFVVTDANSPSGIRYVSNTHAFTVAP